MSTLSVVSSSDRMSAADYERIREGLVAAYGDSEASGVELEARNNQAWARLFARSGWTQEQIAEREGKSRQYVGRLLCFGRFLLWCAPSGAIPETGLKTLTEGKFRAAWEASGGDGDERDRFEAVVPELGSLTLIRERTPTRQVGQRIVDRFADGKWHSLETLRSVVDDDVPDRVVRDTIDRIGKNKTYRCRLERKPVGKGTHYRLLRIEAVVGEMQARQDLDPIIRRLDLEGTRNLASFNPMAMAKLAVDLRNLLDAWFEGSKAPPKSSSHRAKLKTSENPDA